ncbi:hypothetical protein ACLOJK_036158 [Asimina triloba]
MTGRFGGCEGRFGGCEGRRCSLVSGRERISYSSVSGRKGRSCSSKEDRGGSERGGEGRERARGRWSPAMTRGEDAVQQWANEGRREREGEGRGRVGARDDLGPLRGNRERRH